MSKYYNVKTTIDDLAIANKITKTLLEKMLGTRNENQKRIIPTNRTRNKEITFLRSTRNLCRRDKRSSERILKLDRKRNCSRTK